MRTWIVPCLALLLGACAAPAEPTAEIPLTWTGAFGGGGSPPGHIHLLLDETGETWKGTMYFESHEADGEVPRATYRIEGAREAGVVRIVQKEILEADPLRSGQWCLGTYTLQLDERTAAGIEASYAGGSPGCSGGTVLQSVDAL